MARRLVLMLLVLAAISVIPATISAYESSSEPTPRVGAIEPVAPASSVPPAVVPPRSEITSSLRVMQRVFVRLAALVAVFIAALCIAASIRRTSLFRPRLVFAMLPFGSSRHTRGPPVVV